MKRILVFKYNVQPSVLRCGIHVCRQTQVVKEIIKLHGGATLRGRKLIFPGGEVTRQSEDARGPWRGRELKYVSVIQALACTATLNWLKAGGKWPLALGFKEPQTENSLEGGSVDRSWAGELSRYSA